MTALQKQILEYMLRGGNIAGSSNYGYRLRTASHEPVAKFAHATMYRLMPFLKKEKGLYVISKKKVRALSKRYWIKKKYLEILKEQK